MMLQRREIEGAKWIAKERLLVLGHFWEQTKGDIGIPLRQRM